MFLLDSDVLIAHLRGKREVVTFLRDLTEEGPLMISVLNRFEILQGARAHDFDRTRDLLDNLESLAVDRRIAGLAGRVSRHYRSTGETIGPVDCLLAATAMIHDLVVVTFNRKHYRAPGLRVYRDMRLPG